MKKRAVILTCILSASILLSGSYILPLLNHIAEKETKTVKTYQTASQDEAETDSSEADAGDTEDTDSEKSSKDQTVLDQATIMYEQYNYDEAIKLLKGQKDFTKSARLQSLHL